MKQPFARTRLWIALASVTGGVTGGITAAMAFESSWDVGLGVEYSDNVRRVQTNKESELVVVPFVEAAAHEDSERLRLDVQGRAEYRDYTRDTLGSRGFVDLNAAGLFKVKPGSFDWVVEDYFRQAPVDVFLPVTPANWQDANIFATGPELHFRLSPTQQIQVGARWENDYFEKTDADSNRYSGHVSWRSDYAPHKSLSVNYQATRVEFKEDQLYANYDRHDLFAHSDTRHGAVRVEADLGGSRLIRKRHKDLDGWLGRVGVTWYVNPQSELGAWYVSQYSDTSTNLLLLGQAANQVFGSNQYGAIATTGFVDQQVSGDVFKDQRVGVRYAWRGEVNSFNVAAEHLEEKYQEAIGTDRKVDDIRAEYNRKVWPTLAVGAFGERRDIDYTNVDRKDKESYYGVSARYQARRDLRVDLDLLRAERDSTDPASSYKENRVMLYARYGTFTPNARGTAQR